VGEGGFFFWRPRTATTRRAGGVPSKRAAATSSAVPADAVPQSSPLSSAPPHPLHSGCGSGCDTNEFGMYLKCVIPGQRQKPFGRWWTPGMTVGWAGMEEMRVHRRDQPASLYGRHPVPRLPP
jgi:hypothetical protein